MHRETYSREKELKNDFAVIVYCAYEIGLFRTFLPVEVNACRLNACKVVAVD